MKNKIIIRTPKDFSDNEKDKITIRCLEIANKANFPTYYQDMYDHLFGNEFAELFFIIDESKEIQGFATCDNCIKESYTYLHGIIIHPYIQGKGWGLKLLQEIIKKDKNDFLTVRTHNPRIYEMMGQVAYNGLIFPNITFAEVPEEIWEIIYSHPDMKDADKDLIVRGAYPDEKIMQTVKDKSIKDVIFKKLENNDAQVIIVCTNVAN